jgi:hypothetical protein
MYRSTIGPMANIGGCALCISAYLTNFSLCASVVFFLTDSPCWLSPCIGAIWMNKAKSTARPAPLLRQSNGEHHNDRAGTST